MSRSDITAVLGRKIDIPTLSEVAVKAQEMVRDPDVGTREIGEFLAGDAALAAKILRTANSAFYGLAGRCVSVENACTVLGMRALRSIVTRVSVMQAFEHMGNVAEVRRVWERSTQVGRMAAHLAERTGCLAKMDREGFYTCGLLHDIGRVVLLAQFGDEYLDVLEKTAGHDARVPEVEAHHYGFDHADVGAYVANQWGLPEIVERAIQYHHGPVDALARDPQLAIIHVASRLASGMKPSAPEDLLAILSDQAGGLLPGLQPDAAQEIVDWQLGTATCGVSASWDDEDPWD